MSTTPRAITTEAENAFARLKNAFGNGFFLLAQHWPRLLELHRNERAWSLLRFLMGCCGAALVILPLSLWGGYLTALFGCCRPRTWNRRQTARPKSLARRP